MVQKTNLIRPRKPAKARTPAQLDRLRDGYVRTIALARKFEASPNAMIDKAHRLLTRHWGRADWASRAEILKTVEWLLRVSMSHPIPAKPGRPAGRTREFFNGGAQKNAAFGKS